MANAAHLNYTVASRGFPLGGSTSMSALRDFWNNVVGSSSSDPDSADNAATSTPVSQSDAGGVCAAPPPGTVTIPEVTVVGDPANSQNQSTDPNQSINPNPSCDPNQDPSSPAAQPSICPAPTDDDAYTMGYQDGQEEYNTGKNANRREQFAKDSSTQNAYDRGYDDGFQSLQNISKHWEGSRGLSGPERSNAQSVYQDSIDYDKVSIVGGSVAATGATRTIGNSIYMEDELFDGNTSNLTAKGMTTLIHELGHVWQYQHGGLEYIPNSLKAQAEAAAFDGDRDEAYKWRKALNAGKPWAEWNAEQQAEAMEDYYEAKQRLDAGQPQPGDDETVRTLGLYVSQVRSGLGAPGGPAAGPGDYEAPKGDSAPA
jgi:hypothetical protein